LDRNLALELVRVTEAAALASARFFGKGDPLSADRAAVEAMELAFKGVKITGHIVIGEERISEHSKLCTGDVIGAGGESLMGRQIPYPRSRWGREVLFPLSPHRP
jgi:fructose-1,6-bisphosphatase/sedoheptulose 1,7-bisphosphatase-like protein